MSKVFGKYIADKKIVIADGSSSSRTGLAKAMIDLGARMNHIMLVGDYVSATDAITKARPEVVICDYNLGNSCGLDLLQRQRSEVRESTKSLFVLVTGNSSQSAVAQAAEEDVDTYILKPYTIEVLRNSIMKTAIQKINPSPYWKKVTEGKEVLFSGDPDRALAIFQEASSLDPKPALALFYLGQAKFMKKLAQEAQSSYERGLHYNKIHYKCMTGLFDVFMDQKRYDDAYGVAKKISQYFPANPQRLTAVLRLAVITRSYEDIERYYQFFVQMDARTEELVRYMCAALVVCGKYYLMTQYSKRAVELFDKAAIAAAGRAHILREIVISLIDSGMKTEAEVFLKRFPAEIRGGADYLSMEYLVNNEFLGPSQSITRGRELVGKNIEDYYIYKILIARSYEAGFQDSADQLLEKALQKYPQFQGELQKIPKKAAS